MYHGHDDNVFAVAWSPDRASIASGSRDKTIHIWNALTGKVYCIYRDHASYLLSVAWSPDGKYIASGDSGGVVQVWEADTGRNIVSYHGHTRFVRSIAWSPDCSHIASAGDFGDSTVQIWDAFSGHLVYTHKQQYRIFGVSWSPDGKRIASGSFDGSVQTWDAMTGIDIMMYRDLSSPTLCYPVVSKWRLYRLWWRG